MSRFIKNIFLFAFVFVIAYPILIFLTEYLSIPQSYKPNLKFSRDGHLFTRINEAKSLTNDIDILFLGSSHSYRGFDPRNFHGKKTFNLGSSAQTPIQTNVLLNRYLEKLNPKLIIYEVYPAYTFSSDGVESSLDLISNDKNDFYSFRMALELNNIDTYNTLSYMCISNLLNLNKTYEPIKIDNKTYILGGYEETDISFNKSTDYLKQKWTFKDNQIKMFNQNIMLLRKKNIRTILVFAPISQRLYNSYTNNNQVDSIFNTYNLEYYNFNKLINLNDSLDFLDGGHLNQNGVNKFNQKLIEILKL